MSDPGKVLILDLTVTNNPARLIKYHLYHDHYGLDHHRMLLEWNLQLECNVGQKLKRAYDKADWAKIS
jgi:hypothetical protein